MQTEIYVNVPVDFKELYMKIKEILKKIYEGMGISLWTI